MSATAGAARRDGYVHEAAIYDSEEDMLHLVLPHLKAATTSGEPAFAALQDDEATAVRSALDESADVTFLPPLTAGERPAALIRRLTSLVDDLAAEGIQRIRVVNTVPHPGLGAPWDPWRRYEAAVNDILGPRPVWGLCLYDRRVTPDHVLGDVERVHPYVATPEGNHLPNPGYQDPKAFLPSMPPPPPDPLESSPPDVELIDPTPADGRRAVRAAAPRTHLPEDEITNITVAVSEAITNAILHGRPPTTMRLWGAPERIVVTVNDRGPGPQDPYTGLIPMASPSGQGGYGLWITHQLVTTSYARDDGFTIRLIAGQPLP